MPAQTDRLRGKGEFDLLSFTQPVSMLVHWKWLELWENAMGDLGSGASRDSLNEEEILDLSKFLPIAGSILDTLLCSAVHFMLQNPGIEAGLRTQPEQLPLYIAEWQRLFPRPLGALRLANSDVKMGGLPFRRAIRYFLRSQPPTAPRRNSTALTT